MQNGRLSRVQPPWSGREGGAGSKIKLTVAVVLGTCQVEKENGRTGMESGKRAHFSGVALADVWSVVRDVAVVRY